MGDDVAHPLAEDAPVARLICALAAASSALILVLPAAADSGRTARGIVVTATATRIVVRSKHGLLHCAVSTASPSVADYATGDRVAIACRRADSHLVLARIRHLAAAPASSDTAPVTFGGTITALSDSAISLHDGDRNLTCSLSDASSRPAGAKVGDHARVVCTSGVLTSFTLVTAPPPATTGGGTVSALSPVSITIHNAEHGDVTCTLGASSPSLGEIHVGDVVRFGCVGGALVAISKFTPLPPAPAPAPEPHPAFVTYGAISALSATSLTVHNEEHGDLTCSLGDSSPRLGDFHVGDHVQVGCSDGHLLVTIARF